MKTVHLIITPRTSPSLLKSSSSALALASNSFISSIVKFNHSSLEQTSILFRVVFSLILIRGHKCIGLSAEAVFLQLNKNWGKLIYSEHLYLLTCSFGIVFDKRQNIIRETIAVLS